jgi:TonB family protein
VRAKHPGIPPRLAVEVVVDTEGRVRAPVVVSGRLPDLAVQTLESLRGFRFAPATENGAPVAVLAELVVDPPEGQPLPALLSALPSPPEGVDLASVEPLLHSGAGRAGEAARLAARRWDEALNGRARSAEELGAALALRALAEAGADEHAAVCRWQAAQVLSPALYDADLSPYGAAGALLDRNRWGSERWVVHGGVDRGREGKAGAAAAPPRPRVVSRTRPAYPRFLRARRLADAVLLSGVVDEQGGLRQPDLRAASASPSLDAAALDALCGFRFEPARAGGAAVASFYSVTMSFSPE